VLKEITLRKIVYIVSDVQKSLAFEWISVYINHNRFELSFVLLNAAPTELEDFLIKQKIKVQRVNCESKRKWPYAILKVAKYLRNEKPDVVHCHLIKANIIGLIAAKLAGINNRIYTRHHSSLHHIYFPKGVWWDKMSNRLATKIVAISGMVANILTDWERVPSHKVVQVHHGFLLNEFESVCNTRIQKFLQKNNLNGDEYTIGVVSRFTEWKGIQYIIPAFKQFLNAHPHAVLLLLNARGDYEVAIKHLLNDIPVENYRLIPFELDIAAAYKTMNTFVHVPIDEHSEAFGQTYVEALAAGIPSIFTLSGVAPDFIIHGNNALVVPYKDEYAICQSMLAILNNPELRNKLIENGKQSVKSRFELNTMIAALERHYEN
jgi:glycosyltransferase involved in cell wall biosynthesis